MGVRSRPLRFARVGGLSSVKYKPDPSFSGYHRPPARHGIYAFIYPYLEMFLVGWSEENRRELKDRGVRVFDFEGHLYTHLRPDKTPEATWYYVHTEELAEIVRKAQHEHRVAYQKLFGHNNLESMPFDPMKTTYTKDALEVFIPSSELGHVR